MNKHTSGEWVASHEENNNEWGIDSGKWGIAICADAPGDGTAEANARLIAAAPELFEACVTFAEWLRREDEGFIKAGHKRETEEDEKKWRAWYDENLRICDLAQTQARAAIAKATGESK